jgi:hypothetical protein
VYSAEYKLYAASALFHLRVSHSFISRGCAKPHDFIDEVMLLHIFAHPFSELVMLGLLGMHIDVAI